MIKQAGWLEDALSAPAAQMHAAPSLGAGAEAPLLAAMHTTHGHRIVEWHPNTAGTNAATLDAMPCAV